MPRRRNAVKTPTAASSRSRSQEAVEVNRLETWLWLDGPRPERGAGGAARELALAMNALIVGNGVPEAEGPPGWTPGTASPRSRSRSPSRAATSTSLSSWTAAACSPAGFPTARHIVLHGMAHQPYLESPSTVAQLIRSAVTGA